MYSYKYIIPVCVQGVYIYISGCQRKRQFNPIENFAHILLITVWAHWRNPLFSRQTCSHYACWTCASKEKSVGDLKPISTSWSRQGIGFQVESKQVTSLEVITQVGYLAGQTNKAASWHPADRSKPVTDRRARKQRPVGDAPPLVCSTVACLYADTDARRERWRGIRGHCGVTLTVESACENAAC